MGKLIINTRKINEELPYVQYLDVNNLYGWTMSKKVAVNNDFEWIKDTSQFNEDFIKNCNEKSDEGNFLDLMFNILKNYMKFIMVYYFCQNE